MSKPIPSIKNYMTMNPKFVEKNQSLKEAMTFMQNEGFRHLPVLSDGKIQGILSMTDVLMITSFKGANLSELTVQDAYTINPIKVSPQTQLDEVCRQMTSEKIGCVVVEDNSHLVGIFTWIDALEAMEKLLHTRLA